MSGWRDKASRESLLEPRERPATPPPPSRGPAGFFNPQCKHERTSYDILNCDACIAHTKQLEARRLAAGKAADA